MARRRTVPAALACALAAGAGALATAPAAPATAAPLPGGRAGDIVAAARAHHVPTAVLSAYSYSLTRWDDHHGAPSADGGYGPGHLVDASTLETGGRTGDPTEGGAGRDRLDTLGRAARLTGYSRARLRTDPAANLRGAAALLEAAQRRAGGPVGTGTSPAAWYGAIAATAPDPASGVELADAVVGTLRTGAHRVTADGQRVALAPAPVAAAVVAAQRTRLTPKAATRPIPGTTTLDCPAALRCEWLPAPYARTGSAPDQYGNHDVANRPVSTSINTIVIHDTETPYAGSVSAVRNPDFLAWQYTIRSKDGHVAQHVRPRDIGWQSGNWYVNTHSIGVEHEGYAAKGATWFSEPMYRSSATLVRYLAAKYRVPLDRGHIIGHDQVPGAKPEAVAGMHWDPGPYWDWNHYFDLLGAPLTKGTLAPSVRPRAGQVVRVLPTFATNRQPLVGCTTARVACPAQGSNVLPVRTRPSATAPLVGDPGVQGGGNGSMAVSDWTGKVTTGTDYVVAGTSGSWVSIWFAGRTGWVYDPPSAPTLRVVPGRRVAVARTAGVPTYGRPFPEASAYPVGVFREPAVALQTRLAQGQQYVVLDEDPPTDDYVSKGFDVSAPNDHVTVQGTQRHLLVDLGHRVGYVRLADVTVRTAG